MDTNNQNTPSYEYTTPGKGARRATQEVRIDEYGNEIYPDQEEVIVNENKVDITKTDVFKELFGNTDINKIFDDQKSKKHSIDSVTIQRDITGAIAKSQEVKPEEPVTEQETENKPEVKQEVVSEKEVSQELDSSNSRSEVK